MYYNMLTSSYENLKDYKINNITEIDNPNNPKELIFQILCMVLYVMKEMIISIT